MNILALKVHGSKSSNILFVILVDSPGKIYC